MNERKLMAAMESCTAAKSPRRGRPGVCLSPELKDVIHDSNRRCAVATDNVMLVALPSLYDEAKGAAFSSNWMRVFQKCEGAAWSVNVPAVRAVMGQVSKCAKALGVYCYVTAKFGKRHVILEAEYLRRAFAIADALGWRTLTLKADETGVGPVFAASPECKIAIMPFKTSLPDPGAYVLLNGDSLRVVNLPRCPRNTAEVQDSLDAEMRRAHEFMATHPDDCAAAKSFLRCAKTHESHAAKVATWDVLASMFEVAK